MPGRGMLTPHHDGSPLHVSTQTPTLGEMVRVRRSRSGRLRPARVGGHAVEPEPRAAVQRGIRHRLCWRLAVVGGRGRSREPRARLPVAARRRRRPAALAEPARPVHDRGARRRRLPARRARACSRVGGVERHVPGVPRPIRAVGCRALRQAQERGELPEWAIPAEWHDPVDPVPPGRSRQFYGGDLDGVREHLDHLESLGVNLLYLTPVFPGAVEPPLRRVDVRGGRPAARRRRGARAARRGSARPGHPRHRRPHLEPLG